MLLVYGCSIDNYTAPNATLSGKVIDSVTAEMVENGGANAGTIIQVYEGNSRQPILCNSFSDGRFANATFFNGSYKVMAVGAFKMATDTINVSVNGNTEIEIKVIPNVRLKTTLINRNASTATIKVDYEKIHNDQIISQLCIIWSTIPNPNMFTFSGGGQQTEEVISQNLITGEMTFTITGLNAGQKYHIRAAARTNAAGGYYNYSKPIETN